MCVFAERARSISPSKTGPAKVFSTTNLSSKSTTDLVINPPVDFSPSSQRQSHSPTQSLSRSNAVSGRISPTRDNEPVTSRPLPSPTPANETLRPLSTATGLARSGTLSWQQRPTSRDGASPRQRPLSGFATARNLPRPPQDEDIEPSRQDIAASLSQKDPTWFRQTQDRGTGSAAFRKNQVEDTPEPLQSTSMRLPGMAQTREPSKSPMPEAHSERQSPRHTIDLDRYKRGNTPDIVALRDSISMDKPQPRAQQEPVSIRPISTDSEFNDASTSNLTRNASVLASNRPVSPTKGLGGFVESAMMRRSDSVNKRWSVKANTGLRRGDSVAGGRPTSLHSRGLSRDIQPGREASPSSPLASSRPSSSHGRDLGTSAVVGEKSASVEPQERPISSSEDTKKAPEVEIEDSQLDRSPSKTMDPRRWSPTKATWLESALQAESPKPPMLKEEPPKWKVDLQRSRSRASRDVSPEKRTSRQEIDTPLQREPVPPPKVQNPAATETSLIDSTLPAKSVPAKDTPKDTPKPIIKPKPEIISSDASIRREAQKIDAKIPDEPKEAEVKHTDESTRKLPELKPKPQTPPKTDFRSTLKSRGAGPSQNSEAEPEFKAVFGKLKRATTQNYVAPDELKANILGGKAALNATGGPQKTKRVDEFKESILAKKEAMKATSSKSPQRSESPTKEEAPIPEALARRKTLSKASAPNLTAVKSPPRSTTPTPAPKPAIFPKVSGAETLGNGKVEAAPPAVPAKRVVSSERDIKSTSVPEPVVQSKPVPTEIVAKPDMPILRPQPRSLPTPQSVVSKPPDDKLQDNPSWIAKPLVTSPPATDLERVESAGSKLASRINPNLAAMISRGNTPRPQASRAESSDNIATTQSITSASSRKEDESAGSLTHMTKGRAKGPKRRAPKAEGTPVARATPSKPISQLSSTIRSSPMKIATDEPVEPKETVVTKATPTKPSMALRELSQPKAVSAGQSSAKSQTEEKVTIPKVEEPKTEVTRPKPAIANKSPELRKVSSSSGLDEKLRASPKPAPVSKPSWPPASKSTQAEKSPSIEKLQPISPARPVKSNLVVDRVRDNEPKSPTKDSQPVGSNTKSSTAQSPAPVATTKSIVQKPIVKPRTFTPPTTKQQAPAKSSLLPQEIRAIIENYVGPILKDYERADFDSQQFLRDATNSEPGLKTLNHSINEVTGDGKKLPMPPQQDHILYEESMYLITHTFSTSGGTNSSEVYLWSGDRVADASIEDAQVFCRRDAREHNTKLEVVKQGKEPSRLLQALGGILIIRRTKSSALYMLCGRRHLGHIVFDEVEMESGNLCPGYTYLISGQYGKLYLWKGKGAGADEIGSARLIGMDLGLTGEIEEIDDGSEPSNFWAVFGSKTSGVWSNDWCQRAEMNGYPTVMYRVEHERPGLLGNLWGLTRAASPSKGQQMKATCERLESFSQNDLESSAIHIIDAYRTIYVVVTRQCSSKAAELVTALHLAQEFAMLSPATQNRPILPACHVVVGDLTNDAKACFRKWNALQAQSILKKGSLCVRLEEVMDALEL